MHFPSEVTVSGIHRHFVASAPSTATLNPLLSTTPAALVNVVQGRGVEAMVPIHSRFTRDRTRRLSMQFSVTDYTEPVFENNPRARTLVNISAMDGVFAFDSAPNERADFFKRAVGYERGRWSDYLAPFWLFSYPNQATIPSKTSIALTTVVRFHGWDFNLYPSWVAYLLVLRYLMPSRADARDTITSGQYNRAVELESAARGRDLSILQPAHSICFCTEGTDTLVALLPSPIGSFALNAHGENTTIDRGVAAFVSADPDDVDHFCDSIYDNLYDLYESRNGGFAESEHERYCSRLRSLIT